MLFLQLDVLKSVHCIHREIISNINKRGKKMLMMGQKNYDEMKNKKKIINISMLKIFWGKIFEKIFQKMLF